MSFITAAIHRPIAVLAAVIMTVFFGLVALQTIPVQLAPDVNQPVIRITTIWTGAAPTDIEREILIRQEDSLSGLENLVTMTSSATRGRGNITLEFNIGTDMGRALLLTANRLGRVGGYPDEARQPTLSASGSKDSAIAWFVLTRQAGNDTDIHHYGDFAKKVLKNQIERIPGVSGVNIFGGRDQDISIVVTPEDLARHGLRATDLVNSLRRASASVSAGDIAEGKRLYLVRTEGELDSLDAIRAVVLRSEHDPATGRLARLNVGDIADVSYHYRPASATLRYRAESALIFNVTRETGANVITTMAQIKNTVAALQTSVIADEGLVLKQVYDETTYIQSAIDLVRQNIWFGGVFAACVLLLFLRSLRATVIISVAIPVSVIGSFVAMAALGRSINVISLAGLAFAVGMVVDAAIVVLENIYRLREQGKSPSEAARIGAGQVWGAILVSALTTVMVFIPILVMELEIGQLFRDIAVAISVSVVLSLLVSMTVIPALSHKFLPPLSPDQQPRRLPIIDAFARRFVAILITSQRKILTSKARSLVTVCAVVGLTLGGSWFFLPKLDYLPEGNRNLVFGVIMPPPGYNLDTMRGITDRVEAAAAALWQQNGNPDLDSAAPPAIDNFFFITTRSQAFVGASAQDPARVGDLIPLLQKPIFQEPGTFGFMSQPSLFGRGVGGGRKVNIDISGDDLKTILKLAGQIAGQLADIFPRQDGHQFRPKPGLELGAPEIRLLPDRTLLADNGLSVEDFNTAIDVFNDGRRVQQVTLGNRQVDLVLRGPQDDLRQTQNIATLPVVTADGRIVPAATLADIILTSGPTQIRRHEGRRTITLELRPTADIPLESVIDTLDTQIIAPLTAQGLPDDVRLSLRGTADALAKTWDAMVLDLVLAIVIVYLVMAVLFESFLYPLLILLAVPLATAGGVAGLAGLNLLTFQPLDMLTLLGFVILVGIVVNNAILLVHQTLHHLRAEGLAPIPAIIAATRTRVRPIFMSTLTSVVGMLPLVFFPGAGSELYRGLGSVVVGGLGLSAFLTLLIIPPVLALLEQFLARERAQAKQDTTR